MSTDYSKFVELARRLIDKSGRSCEFQKLSAVAADPAKPWLGAGAPTVIEPVTTMAVFLPDGAGFGKLIEDNELFKSSEQMVLVAPPVGGEDLSDYHTVLDGGVRWKINVTKALAPGPVTVLYAMGVSR